MVKQKYGLPSILVLLLIMLITLNTLSKENEENIMSSLIVEKIDTKKTEDNSLLSITLCNRTTRKYFLEKRFIYSFGDKSLMGFTMKQDGKRIKDNGRRVKRNASSFPKDYVPIEPNDCISYTVILNNFFDFKQDKEFLLSYLIMNSNPLSNKLDEISFKDKKIILSK